jgi:hypothetical protein
MHKPRTVLWIYYCCNIATVFYKITLGLAVHPPDKQEKAIVTVIEQAKLLAEELV